MKRKPTENVDKVDLQIINLLQADSRLSHKNIAGKLKIATGTVFNRIKRLEDKGVLKCFTIIVDPAKVGYDLTAVILIEADGKHLLNVEEEIAKMSQVISVYNLTGDYNVAITARLRDKAALDEFINSLLAMPFINRTVANIALNVIKEDLN